jgi:hypothetical protein
MRLLLILVATVVGASSAQATEDCTKAATQPIGDYGFATATYVSWYDCEYPSEVELTTAPNAVIVHGEPENRNQASLLGIKVRLVDDRPREQGGAETMRGFGVFGDTVRVVMDLTGVAAWKLDEALPLPPQEPGASTFQDGRRVFTRIWRETVLETLDCVLLNARRSWPTIAFVDLDVAGSPHFNYLRSVYSLESVPDPCTKEDWSAGRPAAWRRLEGQVDADSSARP